jgi:hypothetical protein
MKRGDEAIEIRRSSMQARRAAGVVWSSSSDERLLFMTLRESSVRSPERFKYPINAIEDVTEWARRIENAGGLVTVSQLKRHACRSAACE